MVVAVAVAVDRTAQPLRDEVVVAELDRDQSSVPAVAR
jgi:hypothetical protein